MRWCVVSERVCDEMGGGSLRWGCDEVGCVPWEYTR